MLISNLNKKYSSPEAWLHDYIIADRALNLHAYIIEHAKLKEALALQKEQRLLDVGCGGGQSAIRLKGLGECWRVLKPGGELLVADATSDATLEQVENFYMIAHFPRLFQKPAAAMLYQRMFQPARSLETYQQIAEQLQMPPGSVSQLPNMPAFLFRTQKTVAGLDLSVNPFGRRPIEGDGRPCRKSLQGETLRVGCSLKGATRRLPLAGYTPWWGLLS